MRFKSRTRVLAAAAMTASLGVAGLATVATPAGAADGDVTRISGANRYATAAAAAISLCDLGNGTQLVPDGDCLDGNDGAQPAEVTLASGLNFPDALAAGVYGDSILLTDPASLSSETADALNKLGDPDVRVVGGTEAVSAQVVGQAVGQGSTVTRVFGATRFETAAAIAVDATGGSASDVFLASGLNFPDALAASAVSANSGNPILLTPPDALHASTASALLDLGTDTIVIVGGTAAVSQDVQDDLSDYSVSRAAGAGRNATAVAVAKLFPGDPPAYTLARNDLFPDALSGGPFANAKGGPLLLTVSTGLSPEPQAHLQADANGIAEAFLLGGTAALSEKVADDVEAAIGGGVQTGSVWTENASADGTFSFDTADGATVAADSDNGTAFTVDGVSVSKAIFNDAVTVADAVTIDGTTYKLTNQTAPLSGLVGLVDTAADEFSIVTAGNHALNGPFVYTATPTFTGAANTIGNFENEVSLGDSVTVTGDLTPDSVALTNGSVSGLVSDVAGAQFHIDRIGDVPELDNLGDAGLFLADGTNQLFTIDGAAATLAQFLAAVSNGDSAVYGRTGNTETFALTNSNTPAATDASFDGHAREQDANNNNTILYYAEGTFDQVIPADVDRVFLNGALATFAEAEAALSADGVAPWGSAVVFEDDPADAQDTLRVTTTGTSTILKADVQLGDITNDDNPANDSIRAQILGGDAAILTLNQEFNAGAGTITYSVNGSVVTYSVFEDYLGEVLADDNFGGDRIQVVVSGTTTQYLLTTNETL